MIYRCSIENHRGEEADQLGIELDTPKKVVTQMSNDETINRTTAIHQLSSIFRWLNKLRNGQRYLGIDNRQTSNQ